jgi:hypothetical protein
MADNSNSDSGWFRDNVGSTYQTPDSKPAGGGTRVQSGDKTGTYIGGTVSWDK